MLREANTIISVTDVITAALKQIAPESRASFHTIPNGYDPDDFNSGSPVWHSGFTLTHIGTLNGSRAKLLKPLLEVIKSLLQANEISPAEFKLKFIGAGSYRELSLTGLGWVEIIPYLPHPQAVQAMCNSDLLILAEASPSAFTGKIFEYLGSGRRILGSVHPQSPAARLLREANSGWVVGPKASADLRAILLKSYQKKMHGSGDYLPVADVVARYSRKAQTEQLAEIITSELAKQKF